MNSDLQPGTSSCIFVIALKRIVMESICIRCGKAFESDTLDIDLCLQCDNELVDLESDDDDGFIELTDDIADGY